MASAYHTDTMLVIEQARRANFMLMFVCALVLITLRAIPPLPELQLPELTEFEELFRYEGLRVRESLLDSDNTTALMLVLEDPPEKILLYAYPLFSLPPLAEDAPMRDLRDRWDELLELPVYGQEFAPFALVNDEWRRVRVMPVSQGYDEPPVGLPSVSGGLNEIFANLYRARELAGQYRDMQHSENGTPEAAFSLAYSSQPVILFFSATAQPIETIPALNNTLLAAQIADYRRPLADFAEYFPFVAQHFQSVADLPRSEALIELQKIGAEVREEIAGQLEDEPPVSIFGLQIPRTDVIAFGSLLVISIQLYFFLHLSAVAQSIRHGEPGALAPWIGLYDMPLARATHLVSVAAPPLIVQTFVMTADLPIQIAEGSAWLVYKWSILLGSIALVVASVVATSKVWGQIRS